VVRLLRAVPAPLVLIVMIGLAGAVLGRVYAGPLLAQLVLGAAAGSVAVSVATRRLPSWLVAPLSVLALAGYAALALRLTAQRAEVPGAFGTVLSDAVRNGIPRLLTAMIPVEPVPDTVVVPLVAAWLAGLAGTELALRAGRMLLGYLPPALLFAGALYVVGPNADAAIWATVAFAATAAVGLAPSGRPSTSSPVSPDGGPAADLPAAVRIRLAAGTAAGVVVVIALAAVVGPVVAGRIGGTPVDPRRYVQPPQVDSLDESPLNRISGWALNPDQKLFDVTTSGADPAAAGAGPTPEATATPGSGGDPAGDTAPEAAGRFAGLRIRLAVLSDYDGATWRVGATYRNAGRILPPTQAYPGSTVDTVRQEVTVADLTGRLLPAVPSPQEVAGARVAYDPGSGTLIRPEGLTAGLRYTVTSARERPDVNLLATADVPSGDAVARVLRVEEGVPDQLRRLADELSKDNGAPYARAVAIEEFLAGHYREVADAPSGHAYPNLNFFLFGPPNGGGQRGTSEQFAAAYAVLGRLMGLPTRVVVGFNSATGNGPVHGADAYAWPEVLFNEVGWVAFDPLPKPNTEPRPVEEDFKPKPEDPPPTPDEATPSAAPAESTSPAPAAQAPTRGGIPGSVLAGGGTGALLLILGGLVVVVLALRRAQRRRRLDEGPPAQRIAGAWREVTDALRLAGQPAAAHLAATEVAAHARALVGGPATDETAAAGTTAHANAAGTTAHSGAAASPTAAVRPPVPPIDELASLVNLAAFAPGATSEEQARQAGTQAAAYATALRAGRPWWRRIVWSLHPGPLRWRR
jgi:transglutaminase-like putative cysteine protease